MLVGAGQEALGSIIEPVGLQTVGSAELLSGSAHRGCGDEQRVQIASDTAFVVGQGHRCAAHDKELCLNAASGQALGELPEQTAHLLRIELPHLAAHARFRDRPVMKIPRWANARGLSWSASGRQRSGTAGYQLSVRRSGSAAHAGACQPSRSAR
jgi:hypothetical protein